MKEIKIHVNDVLYEKVEKILDKESIINRIEGYVENDFAEIIAAEERERKFNEENIFIKILDEKNELYDGFYFEKDEKKAKQKMDNFRKYKYKYKKEYKDKIIELYINNEVKDRIIVNEL